MERDTNSTSRQRTSDNSGVLIAVGVCMVAMAVPFAFFIYAHATMVDPSLSDAEWRRQVAMKFFFHEAGIGSFSLLAAIGGAVCIVRGVMRQGVSGLWILFVLVLFAAALIATIFA